VKANNKHTLHAANGAENAGGLVDRPEPDASIPTPQKRADIEWPRSSDHGSRENTDRTDGCEDGRRISPTGLSRRPTSGADFHRKSAIGRSQSLLRDANVGSQELWLPPPAHPLRVFVAHRSGEYAEHETHAVCGDSGHRKRKVQQALDKWHDFFQDIRHAPRRYES
jgi:hypothetical protein